MEETLFYVCGSVLVVVALAVSFAGLRSRSFPGPLFAAVIAVFALLVGATTTFAVRYSQEEAAHREAEHATEAEHEAEEAEAVEEEGAEEAAEEPVPGTGGPEAGGDPGTGGAGGPGGTLQLAADPVQLLFDKTELTSKPGEVTIEFTNPAAIQHDVAILRDGDQLAKSDLIGEGETSVSAELTPGTYSYICTVPGHAEAGMEGTLTVR